MADVINLLPDSIANQIAAGEVVQRPASVVKELLENSIDAGAQNITLRVRDGGKESIQVQDDGVGMSSMDALLCFERHSTSKIHDAHDLDGIVTMGFRGEALASIAAVSEVSLTTRRAEDETGQRIVVRGSLVTEQSPQACPQGAIFEVRNLFFNVPARRRFLKSTSREMKHVVAEFQRVALSTPRVAMRLYHNDDPVYSLPSQSRYERILRLFGHRLEEALIPVRVGIESLEIEGYISRPAHARKRGGEQFFFVNGRYMRNPYFHRAVLAAYERLIPPDAVPAYFLFFAVAPDRIDVNIHPTKTEIKFEDERHIWQILNAGVRESLGQFGGVPDLPFDSQLGGDSTFYPPSAPVVDFELNTRDEGIPRDHVLLPSRGVGRSSGAVGVSFERAEVPSRSWSEGPVLTLALGHGYLLTPHRDGYAVVDQHRAHARILFERLQAHPPDPVTSLQLLFPAQVVLSPGEAQGLDGFVEAAREVGVQLAHRDGATLILHAVPQGVEVSDPEGFVRELLARYQADEEALPEVRTRNRLANLAVASAYRRGNVLPPEAMNRLVVDLFSCREPALDPLQRPTYLAVSLREIQKQFQH